MIKLFFIIIVLSSINLIYADEYQFEELHDQIFDADYNNPSSSREHYFETSAYQEMKAMGVIVIPFLVEKIKDHEGKGRSNVYSYMIWDISKLRMLTDTLEDNFPTKPETIRNANLRYVTWWEQGKPDIKQKFEEHYLKWKELPQRQKFNKPYMLDEQIIISLWRLMPEGPEKENLRPYNRTTYQRILDLGIPALPYAVEKVAQGDTDLIEAINYWTDSAFAAAVQEAGVEADRIPEYVSQWWEENQEQWTLPENEK